MRQQRIGVIGSLNVDYVLQLKRLPKPGETLAATSFAKHFGGKGANQALATHRMGAEVTLIGAIGNDADGMEYLAHLEREGLSSHRILQIHESHTGMAYITVDENAENSIVIAAGANGAIRHEDLTELFEELSSFDALLLQFEIPESVVLEICRQAEIAQIPVILNPSPWSETFPWGEFKLHTLIVNEHEAALLLAHDLSNLSTKDLQSKLAELQIAHLVITRGGDSTLFYSSTEKLEVPALKVQPVDTVGAGDTFTGAYTAHLNRPPMERLRLSNAAGALATTKAGAQTGMPTLAEVQNFLL